MAFEIIWEPRGVHRRFYGAVAPDDLLKSVETVHNDPRFDSLFYSINDFLGVENENTSLSAVEDAAARAIGASLSNRKLMLAVVTVDERIRSLASVFSSAPYTSFPTRVFPTIEDARAWIGQAYPELQEIAGAGAIP